MRNIVLELAFDGTAYHGWQVQPCAPTVQQTVQDALQRALGERPGLTGCSRTDAGVHARSFVCNFRTGSGIPCEGLRLSLNAFLPGDVCAMRCTEASESFHARYSAGGKEYCYELDTSPTRDPFLWHRALHYPHPLDASMLDRAARCFCGTHDFKACRASGANLNGRGTVRTVFASGVRREGQRVTFTVSADGFLYNMVRILTGTLLYVAQGKLDVSDLPALLEAGDRTALGPTVPACGLYLNRVFYPGPDRPFETGTCPAAS